MTRPCYFQQLGTAVALEFARITLLCCGLVILAGAIGGSAKGSNGVLLDSLLVAVSAGIVSFGAYVFSWGREQRRALSFRAPAMYVSWYTVTVLAYLTHFASTTPTWFNLYVILACGVAAALGLAGLTYRNVLRAEFR